LGMAKIDWGWLKFLGSDIDNSRCVKRGFLGVLYYLKGYFKKRHNPLGVDLATLATPLATPLVRAALVTECLD